MTKRPYQGVGSAASYIGRIITFPLFVVMLVAAALMLSWQWLRTALLLGFAYWEEKVFRED